MSEEQHPFTPNEDPPEAPASIPMGPEHPIVAEMAALMSKAAEQGIDTHVMVHRDSVMYNSGCLDRMLVPLPMLMSAMIPHVDDTILRKLGLVLAVATKDSLLMARVLTERETVETSHAVDSKDNDPSQLLTMLKVLSEQLDEQQKRTQKEGETGA